MASPETGTSARREELLTLGIRLFSERPFDELSMDDIAAEAGVVKGLLYYYFGSKRGFYVAAVGAAAAELRGQWDTDAALAPVERLQLGIEAYLRHARDRAEGYRTTMAGGVGSDPEVRAILAAERELVVARVVSALGLSHAPPALRVALQGWLSFLEGATLDWLENRDLEERQLRDLLLSALRGALSAANGVDAKVPFELS